MRNALLIKIPLVCFICLAGILATGCQGHSHSVNINSLEPISLKTHEQVYEGFLLSSPSTWQAFVKDMKDLHKPGGIYWAKYDPVVFKDSPVAGEVRQVGEWVDWPSHNIRTRAIWVKFVGAEPKTPLKLTSDRLPGRPDQVAEIDNQLIIKRIITYSNEPVEKVLSEWP